MSMSVSCREEQHGECFGVCIETLESGERVPGDCACPCHAFNRK